MFVMHNRSGGINPNSEYTDNNLDGRYDIVIGPIADDGVALQLRRYTENMISLRTLVRELTYRKLNNQYCFCTEQALEKLNRI